MDSETRKGDISGCLVADFLWGFNFLLENKNVRLGPMFISAHLSLSSAEPWSFMYNYFSILNLISLELVVHE